MHWEEYSLQCAVCSVKHSVWTNCVVCTVKCALCSVHFYLFNCCYFSVCICTSVCTGIFKASALWADGFYKSKCPLVCPCVCLFTFEVAFKSLFAPTSRSRISKVFWDSECKLCSVRCPPSTHTADVTPTLLDWSAISFTSLFLPFTKPKGFVLHTVSPGEGFGSKGKQHLKSTALETQSHSQWSHKMIRKSWIVSQGARPDRKYQYDHQWPLST